VRPSGQLPRAGPGHCRACWLGVGARPPRVASDGGGTERELPHAIEAKLGGSGGEALLEGTGVRHRAIQGVRHEVVEVLRAPVAPDHGPIVADQDVAVVFDILMTP